MSGADRPSSCSSACSLPRPARACRDGRSNQLRSALVIDDVLVLRPALIGRSRLSTLFACTLPFTDARPWADTGTPPPEMFFGRDREMSSVQARAGEFTHLIFGGRQLGKTALLRQVERSATEERDTVACYISIAQIGLTQRPEDLWTLLAGDLTKAGVPISLPPGKDATAAFRTRCWLGLTRARRARSCCCWMRRTISLRKSR